MTPQVTADAAGTPARTRLDIAAARRWAPGSLHRWLQRRLDRGRRPGRHNHRTCAGAGNARRALWPGKPILDLGYEFSQTYYELPATVYTSSAITPVGDLYRHGGWIRVTAGMFLFGCGVRLVDDVIDLCGNPQSIFLFMLLFPSLVNQEDDWVGMLAGIPAILLIWLFAGYLTFRRESGRLGAHRGVQTLGPRRELSADSRPV